MQHSGSKQKKSYDQIFLKKTQNNLEWVQRKYTQATESAIRNALDYNNKTTRHRQEVQRVQKHPVGQPEPRNRWR